MSTAYRPRLRTPLASSNAAYLLSVTFALSCCSLAARAEALPLPAADQELVNKAIDRGVEFLKRAQFQVGTWPQKDDHYIIGYTALPGLTLLECGVPADDPAVRRAADLVRKAVPGLEKTYEISLAILFLDRLGDPKDKKHIQSLALRLVAGQSPTGGWGYKCPALTARQSTDLLTALRKTEPESLPIDLVVNRPRDAGSSRPIDLDPKPSDRSDTSKPSDPTRGDANSRDIRIDDPSTRSPGEQANDPSPTGEGEKRPSVPRDRSRRSPRWGWCIKYQEEPDNPRSRTDPAPQKKYVVPGDLRNLVVFQDPKRLLLVDPKDAGDKLIICTTDNSNTQFAILALWAARRHEVPLQRSLLLIARRFDTSQNANGSWDYHYRYGGSPDERPAMTAVGLIGLAVGHGLASDTPGRAMDIRDPRILAGFVALNRNVGTPTGRMKDVGKANLYYLWSVERVAMLYNLQKIGGKDWYRWGAEILVANQAEAGNWDEGQYHAAHPTIDTCLALLFLKRANLAKDLSSRLTIDAQQLNRDIETKAAEQSKEKPKEEEKPITEEKPREPETPRIESKPDGETTKQQSLDSSLRSQPESGGATADESAPRRPAWGYALIILGVLLLAAVIFFIVYQICRKKSASDEDEDDENDKHPARRRRVANARRAKDAARRPSVKE